MNRSELEFHFFHPHFILLANWIVWIEHKSHWASRLIRSKCHSTRRSSLINWFFTLIDQQRLSLTNCEIMSANNDFLPWKEIYEIIIVSWQEVGSGRVWNLETFSLVMRISRLLTPLDCCWSVWIHLNNIIESLPCQTLPRDRYFRLVNNVQSISTIHNVNSAACYRNKSLFVIKIRLSYKLFVCQQITESSARETLSLLSG